MTHSPLTSIETLGDPTTATNREHVDRRERRRTLDPDEYDAVAAEYDDVDGHARVGVVDDEGRVLLVGRDDETTGWRTVDAPVGSGEDWIAAASEHVAAVAGFDVEVEQCYHVRRTKHVDETDGRTLKTYEVVLRARPSGDASVPETVEVDGEELELAWFEEPPGVVAPEDLADVNCFFE